MNGSNSHKIGYMSPSVGMLPVFGMGRVYAVLWDCSLANTSQNLLKIEN